MIQDLTSPIINPENIPTKQEELSMLKSLPLDELLDQIVSSAVHFAINLAIAIVVLYVGKFIISKINSVLTAIFVKRNVDRSLTTFVLSLIKMVLYFILIVTIISVLGIETSSFIAIFASAGVAIGMALSGTLQNFAGGVLILLFKPYKVGDYIEASGYAGTVKEIQIFNTVIVTPDNKSIIIPNGGLSTGSINNYSREPYRRVDWTIGISYGDSVAQAREAIMDIIMSDKRILCEGDVCEVSEDGASDASNDGIAIDPDEVTLAEAPEAAPEEKHSSFFGKIFGSHGINGKLEKKAEEAAALLLAKPNFTPVVFVSELADSSVVLVVRAWVRTGDYWGVYFDLNERFYTELPDHGVNFPFPQLDVHFDKQP